MKHFLLFSEDDDNFISVQQYIRDSMMTEENVELTTASLSEISNFENEGLPTVLILDDIPEELLITYRILHEYFQCLMYRITNVEMGIEAIKKIKPWIIVVDMSLDDSDGDNFKGYNIIKQLSQIESLKIIPSVIYTKRPITDAQLADISHLFYVCKNDSDSKLKLQKCVRDAAIARIIRKENVSKEEAEERLISLRENHSSNNCKLSELNIETIVGNSSELNEALKNFYSIAESDAALLILGESGTGKEVVARAIHNYGKRKDEPFIVVDSASIPSQLLESELFGHEKGAFTDAHKQKKGRFELAPNGTIFLDEIGELELFLQAKILRAIQHKEFERVGGTEIIKTNARIISATNVNLEDAIKKNKFRKDLYYRISTLTIDLPPLRERMEDIPILVNHFIKKYQHENDNISYDSEFIEALQVYNWPGNIRELENEMHRVIDLATRNERGEIILQRSILSVNIIKNANNTKIRSDFNYIATKLRYRLYSQFSDDFWNDWEYSINVLKEQFLSKKSPSRKTLNILEESLSQKEYYKKEMSKLIENITPETITKNFKKLIDLDNSLKSYDSSKLEINNREIHKEAVRSSKKSIYADFSRESFHDDFLNSNEVPFTTANQTISILTLWTYFVTKEKIVCLGETIGIEDDLIKRGLLCTAVLTLNLPTQSSFEILRLFFSLSRDHSMKDDHIQKTKIVLYSFSSVNPRNFYKSIVRTFTHFDKFWSSLTTGQLEV